MMPRLLFFFVVALSLASMSGCKRLHRGGPEYVYVVPKTSYLRERVAAVSNRTGDIRNGQRLQVLEHDRRFMKVRTPDGKVGWLEEHTVLDQAAYDRFQQLDQDHAHAPVVATAVLRDELYLHLTPGRKTERLFLLPESDKLALLERASVEKPLPPQALLMPAKPKAKRPPVPGMAPRPKLKVEKRPPSGSTIWAPAPPHPEPGTAPDLLAMEDQAPLEDWWLVRDQAGKVGWVLARRLDVDIPDQVAQYSEGKRIVGAYVLNTVFDPGRSADEVEDEPAAGKHKRKGAKKHPLVATPAPKPADDGGPDAAKQPPSTTEKQPTGPRNVAQYVTVTSEWTDGLPFDWDQVRVFIWNVHKHRYETAYRLREQQGYLPVRIGQKEFKDANGKSMGLEPTFTIRTTPDGVVTRDAGGVSRPAHVIETTYRLEGGIVRSAEPLPPKPKPEVRPGAAPVRRARARRR
jgi:hypothetical protein